MIASLRGQVLSRTGGDVVLEVGNIGYLVAVPDRLAASVQVGESLMLHTAMVVRDDHVALFGFDSPEELNIFDLLRSVSGVGPKSALAILGHLSIDDISDAVVSENDGAFRMVSGIGPKTAKLIVLSLQGAFEGHVRRSPEATRTSAEEAIQHSVVEALTGLGWQEKVAKDGVHQALEEAGAETVDAAQLLRATLTILGPQANREGRA
jgi:Holliday junction DNA helicase RuvA